MKNSAKKLKQRHPVERKSAREYFLLLPPILTGEFLEKTKHPDFEALPAKTRLPFHVTLYYLGGLSPEALKSAAEWLEEKRGKQETIKAKINSISSFKRSSKDFVYFLNLASRQIEELNQELFEKFSHLRKDDFSFKAHMTLFYSTEELKEYQIEKLYSLFAEIHELNFDQLALGSVLNNEIEIHRYVELA